MNQMSQLLYERNLHEWAEMQLATSFIGNSESTHTEVINCKSLFLAKIVVTNRITCVPLAKLSKESC